MAVTGAVSRDVLSNKASIWWVAVPIALGVPLSIVQKPMLFNRVEDCVRRDPIAQGSQPILINKIVSARRPTALSFGDEQKIRWRLLSNGC
jgi:hypothetical protein